MQINFFLGVFMFGINDFSVRLVGRKLIGTIIIEVQMNRYFVCMRVSVCVLENEQEKKRKKTLCRKMVSKEIMFENFLPILCLVNFDRMLFCMHAWIKTEHFLLLLCKTNNTTFLRNKSIVMNF